MRNLGHLLVTLGLDNREFLVGIKKAQEQLKWFAWQAKYHATTGISSMFQNMGAFMQNTLAPALGHAGQKLKDFGWATRRIGIDVTTYLITPLAAVGTMAFNLYKGFEFSMTKITSLVGVAAEQVREWNKDVLQISKVTGRGPKELADALYFITSAGVRGAEALEILNASAKAATAGLGETKTIAQLTVSAVNAYGKENINAAEATDILVGAVKEGQAEASEFASTMGRLLPVASEMGVEFWQVGGAMAAMTRTGSEAAEAATQLRQIMFSLAKPARQSEQALARMGTSSEQLRKAIRERGLLEGLMEIKNLTNQYGEEMMSRVFPNIRAFVGVLDLLGSNMEENREIMERMSDTVGINEKAFKTSGETLQTQFNKAVSSVKVELIKLGEVLKGSIIRLLNTVEQKIISASDKFHSLTQSQKENILETIAQAAAIGALTTAASIIIITLGNLLLMLQKLVLFMAANPYAALAIAIIALLPKIDEWISRLRTEIKLLGQKKVKLDDATKALLQYRRAHDMPEGTKQIQQINEELKQTALNLDKGLKQSQKMNKRQLETLLGDLIDFKERLEDLQLDESMAPFLVFGEGMLEKLGNRIEIIQGRIQNLEEEMTTSSSVSIQKGFIEQLREEIEQLQQDLEKLPKGSDKFIEIQAKIADKQKVLDDTLNLYNDLLQQKENFESEVQKIENEYRSLSIKNRYSGAEQAKKLLELEKDLYFDSLAERLKDTELTESQIYEIKKHYLELYAEKVKEINQEIKKTEMDVANQLTELQRDAMAERIKNDYKGAEQQKKLLMAERSWFIQDQEARVTQGEITRDQLNKIVETYDLGYEERMESIGSGVDDLSSKFKSLGESMIRSLSAGAESWDEYKKQAAQAVKTTIAQALAASVANAIQGGTESGKAAGPLAIVAIPAAIALLMGAVFTAFSQVPKMASGGIVPPGFPNDTYPALLTSGEKVIPAPLANRELSGGQVRFEIEGERLVGILQKMNYRNAIS